MNRNPVLAWALAALMTSLFVQASQAAEDTIPEGSYVIVADQSADIAAAIDTATAKMNFIKRPIARSRLSKTNTAYQRIYLASTPSGFDITFDQRKPIRMPANGAPVKWTREDGEVFDVSIARQGAHLMQTFKAKDGTRVNTFSWEEGGKRMVLDVVVSSEQLPQPLKYLLVYQRAE